MTNRDKELDMIYDGIDCLLKDGQFSFIDWILKRWDIDLGTTHDLLSLLTTTLPAKSKLTWRPRFYRGVKRVFTSRYGIKKAEELLQGLD